MPSPLQPEQLVLSNGIPVILQNYDGMVAATYWWVKVGSADEAPDEAGFAHFLEHMLFKDAAAKETGKASTGQMAQAVESLGGDINAYTSFDQTVYHVTCAAHHWEKVLDSFGSMAKPQKFLRDDFEREREVILEELKKNEDSPGRQLFQGLLSTTFAKHPYGRPVIGYVKTLKAATVGKLEAFYRRSYVPENMGIVLVGPVGDAKGARRKTILKLLEKHFGSKSLPRRTPKFYTRPMDNPLRKQVQVCERRFSVKTPTLALAFRAPDLRHPDIPALDVTANVLSMGELSRLYQKLFYETSTVTDISGGLYVPRDPGLLYFQAELDSVERLKPALETICGEINRLKEQGPTKEELSRVIVNAESERLYATQTADGMAGRLGFMRFVLGDLEFDQRYLEQIKAVNRKKVQETASEYFDHRRMSISVLLPKEGEKVDLSPLQELATRMLAPAPLAAKPAVAKGKMGKLQKAKGAEPELIELSSGLKIVYRENPQSHVFSIHSVMLGGLRQEIAHPIESTERDWGASYLMSLTWTKGTRTRDARSIASLVEGHAAGLDGFSGRNTVGVQMTGLARDWDHLSSLMGDVLLDPSFPADEVEHSKRVAEDTIRGIEDHSSQLCSKLFLETLFERHPYGRLTTGSLESISKMAGQKLEAFHQRWIRPDRMVIAAVGNIPRDDLGQWMEELDNKLKGRTPPAQTGNGNGESVIADEPLLKAPRWVERNLGREQLHIIVGGLGTKVTAHDRYPLRLMQTLLGGQSGRLFIELREKKSLAYTVAPISFEGMERGYIGTYIACSPQKREEATRGIREVVEQLAAKGPTPAEMKRAKEFFLGRRAMELQSDSALASHYSLKAIYDIPLHEDEEIAGLVERVSAKDIQRVCKTYLVDPPMVTAVVG